MRPPWLGAIVTRSAAAMPGPWIDNGEHEHDPLPFATFERQIMGADASVYLRGATDAEMEFIAHARTDLPALCALVEALGEALDRYSYHPVRCASHTVVDHTVSHSPYRSVRLRTRGGAGAVHGGAELGEPDAMTAKHKGPAVVDPREMRDWWGLDMGRRATARAVAVWAPRAAVRGV